MDYKIKVIGASNHSQDERQKEDYYATHPSVVKELLEVEQFSSHILEPACGEGHLSKEIEKDYVCDSCDIINRGYGIVEDFFNIKEYNGDIITNPPYSLANKWIEHGMEILNDGNKMALLLPLRYLEGKARKTLYEKYPIKTIYIFSYRIKIMKNGDFDNYKGNAVAYAWYVWQKGYKGITELKII